jgi:hypothetical protein
MVRSTSSEGGVLSKEFYFFANPLISKLFILILELGLDLHGASTRIHALEMQLVRNGDLKQGELDGFRPMESEKIALEKNRDEFMGRLMRIIIKAGPSEHPLREQWDETIAEPSADKR